MPSVYLRAAIAASATNLTALNNTDGFTVAAWLKPAYILGDGIFRQTSTANASRDGYLINGGRGFGVRICDAAAASDSTLAAASLSQGANNQWVHWVWVFQNSIDRAWAYVNGVLVQAPAINSRNMTSNAACTTEVCHNGPNGFYRGGLFDLQVLPGYFANEGDAKRLMNPLFKHEALVARWFGKNFTQPGASGTVYDESGNGNNLTASATLANCLQGAEPPIMPTAG